jgi:hypothetical protein
VTQGTKKKSEKGSFSGTTREKGLLEISSIAIARPIDPDRAIARRTDRLGVTGDTFKEAEGFAGMADVRD